MQKSTQSSPKNSPAQLSSQESRPGQRRSRNVWRRNNRFAIWPALTARDWVWLRDWSQYAEAQEVKSQLAQHQQNKRNKENMPNELKASEERGIQNNRFGYRNEVGVGLGLLGSSGVTSLNISRKGPRGGCEDIWVRVSAEDLRRLAQICLDFADKVDAARY